MSAPAKNRLTVAWYSTDPASLNPFRSFDPDSYLALSALYDTLVHVDESGRPAPSLATVWTQASPTKWHFELRHGVRFSNGDLFNADDVVATFNTHFGPSVSPLARGILAAIKSITKVAENEVCVETYETDPLLVLRLSLLSVASSRAIAEQGFHSFDDFPVGTGAYRLQRYERGRELIFERNPDHWAGRATLDEFHLPILSRTLWLDYLREGKIDLALNLDSQDFEELEGSDIQLLNEPASLARWFLLRYEGPLADLRVRKALNYAVHAPLILDAVNRGFGNTQRSVAQVWQAGYVEDPTSYPYNLARARELLCSAGYANGFTLNGLVSEESVPTFLVIKELYARIGVTLDASIVPRPELMRHAHARESFEGDFLVMLIDNPINDPLFSHFLFLHSEGLFSLAKDPAYDELLASVATSGPHTLTAQRRKLENYVADQAMMVFTNFQHVYAAARPNVSLPLPRSGHFNTLLFWDARKEEDGSPVPEVSVTEELRVAEARNLQSPNAGDLQRLLKATSRRGIFGEVADEPFQDTTVDGIWKNLTATEKRWRLQSSRLMSKLVEQLETQDNLNNILDSTQRVAIVGYSVDGHRTFVNAGYRQMIGDVDSNAFDLIEGIVGNPSSFEILEKVEIESAWTGSVIMPARGQNRSFHLAVTESLDETLSVTGYTLVFSDISGEQERIRTRAIRDILEHVPYGLLMVDRDHRVLQGYSSVCDDLLVKQGPAIEGEMIESLLGLGDRDGDNFFCNLEQVFDDILPEELLLDQIPHRVQTRDKWIGVSASPIRDQSNQVSRVLFSLLDISDLVQAEIGQQHREGILQVLMHKSAFVSFIDNFDDELETLAKNPDQQVEIRRALHTAKGVFGQFAIGQIAHRIHQMEEQPHLSKVDLDEIRQLLRDILAENEPYWSIQLGGDDDELVVSRAILREIRELVAEANDISEARRAVADAVTSMEEKPFSDVVGPIKEACESHAARREKDAVLTLVGGDVRVPDAISKALGSITHLVRNAIDHGVEGRGERGDKSEVAEIRVEVERTRDLFRVVITDDGRGIDAEALVEKAISMQLLDAQRAQTLTRAEQLRLIFADRLSTASTVTDTSGRGVGMAAVEAAVQSCGGTIMLESTPGKGSRFELQFPIECPRDIEAVAN